MDNINVIFDDAKVDAGRFDPDDLLCFGKNYFACGYHPDATYYNHTYAVAIAIIGKIYGSKYGNMSNYHKGIAYIAEEVGVSKRCVKALRKKMKGQGGYIFKTPYSIPQIVDKIVKLLQPHEKYEMVVRLVKNHESDLYREILIGKQYAAINAAANAVKRKKVLEVSGELACITARVSR